MSNWVETKDGSFTQFNEKFQETYHSRSGAWSESQNVFLQPFVEQEQLYRKPEWRILDIGFGLGLNWLCYMNLFLHRQTPLFSTDCDNVLELKKRACRLRMVSFENDAEVLTQNTTQRHLGCFPVQELSLRYLKELKSKHVLSLQNIECELRLENAVSGVNELANAGEKFDVVLLDAFSPRRNPECWNREFLEQVARCCEPGSLFLTYSVAGDVRRNLSAVGFAVDKKPGFGHKRERMVAQYSVMSPCEALTATGVSAGKICV